MPSPDPSGVTDVVDVIDRLAGIAPGDTLDTLRRRRPLTRLNAQQSYLALFQPQAPAGEPTAFTAVERFAVAAFVAGLHRQAGIAAFYTEELLRHAVPAGLPPALAAAVSEGLADGLGQGPYGRFPEGPLSREDCPGPAYTLSEPARAATGPRLAAALAHAHLLVFHPRDAQHASLQALLAAGWSATDVVTLSQLVAFLAFQIRVVAGLKVLAARPAGTAAPHP